MKTLRVCPDNLRHVKQESLAVGIASQSRKPLGSRMMMSAGWHHCGSCSTLKSRGNFSLPLVGTSSEEILAERGVSQSLASRPYGCGLVQ